MYISLFFDVEDVMNPVTDDTARDLAEILTAHGLAGDFMVTGDKARILVQRQRWDVIAALGRQRIGLHTNRHSRHPNVAEYLEDKRWEDGIDEAMRREGPGVKTINEVFGQNPSSWGQSGGSWAPQIHPALRRLGVPTIVYPHTSTPTADVHWYAGSLTFGYRHAFTGFDGRYSDDAQFQEHLHKLQQTVESYLAAGFPWMCLFCGHPVYIRTHEFGDAVNLAHGVDTPPEQWKQSPPIPDADYAIVLKNFSLMLDYLVAHPQVQVTTVDRLTKEFGQAPVAISYTELLAYAESVVAAEDIQTDDPRLSAAEAVAILARAIPLLAGGQKPAQFAITYVDGPTTMPPEQAAATISLPALLEACAAATSYIEQIGRLPASVSAGGRPIAIGSFYRGLCACFVAFAGGHTAEQVTLRPGPQIPAIADTIAAATDRGYRGWVIHKPDLHTENLLELTRLQCWTLKPATQA